MPWWTVFLVCLWHGHVWGQVIRYGATRPFQQCARCGVSRDVEDAKEMKHE